MIDGIDRAILQYLQENSRIANAEIARRVGLAPTAIFQRIRKLEEAGVIRGYTAELDTRKLGYGLTAFVMIQTTEGAEPETTGALLSEIAEVQEVHRVIGEDCFIAKVRVRDTDALIDLLDHKIRKLQPVASTRTTIVLSTAKEGQRLPLGDGAGSRTDA